MPFPLQIAIVFLVGLGLGAMINLAIYQLAFFNPRRISPWGPAHPDAKPRKWIDRVPVIGWFVLSRDEPIHGKAYWSRPAALELFFGAALAMFFVWEFSGGLTKLPHWPTTANLWIWFGLHGFLLVLLTIATFIDFDEKTIPDQITVTGTIFALVFAACVPISRLPLAASGAWLHLDSPTSDFPGWATTHWGAWLPGWRDLASGVFRCCHGILASGSANMETFAISGRW